MQEQFTTEEINLMCIFNTDSKVELIAGITAAIPYFDEPELTEIAENVLAKLHSMDGVDFAALELYPEYEDFDESEV